MPNFCSGKFGSCCFFPVFIQLSGVAEFSASRASRQSTTAAQSTPKSALSNGKKTFSERNAQFFFLQFAHVTDNDYLCSLLRVKRKIQIES